MPERAILNLRLLAAGLGKSRQVGQNGQSCLSRPITMKRNKTVLAQALFGELCLMIFVVNRKLHRRCVKTNHAAKDRPHDGFPLRMQLTNSNPILA